MIVSSSKTASASPGVLEAPQPNQVGSLARTGALWAFMQTIGSQLIGIVSTAVLSRLLLPSDYGVMGMVHTLIALLGTISGIGLSWSTVQRKDLTLVQVHNMFWTGTVVGVLLWGAAITAAPFLANFYHQSEVAPVAMAIGSVFVIGGMATQPLALLSRRMQFQALAKIELAVQIVGTAVAIMFAVQGAGYWALVASAIVSQGIRLGLALVTSRYRPGTPRRDAAMKSLISFGGYLMLTNVVVYVTRNFDNIIVGRVWGPEELGYYTRAYFLMTVPTFVFTGALDRVMVPALSAIKEDAERMGSAYRKALRSLAFPAFPVAIGIAVTSPEAVRLVYGPQWSAVVPILAVFSVSMLTDVVGGTRYWLFTATGRSRLQFGLLTLATLLIVPAMLIGVRYGPVGVAASYVLVTGMLMAPTWLVAHRVASIPFIPTLRVLWPAFLIALVMGVTSWTAGWLARDTLQSWAATLAVKVGIGVLVYGFLAARFLAPWPIPVLEQARLRVTGRLIAAFS